MSSRRDSATPPPGNTAADPVARGAGWMSHPLHRFLVVGTANTALSWAVYWAVLPFAHHQLAFLASSIAGMVFSAWAHARFSFGLRLRTVGLAAYWVYSVCFYLFCAGLLELIVAWLGVPKAWANVLVTILALPVNFAGSRWLMTRFSVERQST